METLVQEGFTLSSEDKDLLLKLLEREQARLPIEIRHTYNREFRAELKRRLDQVDRLIERLKTAA